MKRLSLLVFATAAVVWAVLIVAAIRYPESETHSRAQARARALLPSFAPSTHLQARPRAVQSPWRVWRASRRAINPASFLSLPGFASTACR